MRRMLVMLLAVFLTLTTLGGCGNATQTPPSENNEAGNGNTAESAASASEAPAVPQKDSITVYVAFVEDEAAAIFGKFTTETGVKVNYVRLSAGECITRMEAEAANPQVSVLLGGSIDTVINAYNKGLIEPYVSANIGVVNPKFVSEEGIYTPISIVVTGFVSNNAWLQANGLDAPTAWAELITEQYADNVCLAHPATSGAAYLAFSTIVQLMGEDEGFEYLKKLDNNIVQYTKAGAAPMRMAGLGETGVAIGSTLDGVIVVDEGYDLTITYPEEGTGYEISCVSLVKGGPAEEQEAAKKFIDWMLGDSAQQQATDQFYRYPINEKIPVNPSMVPFEDVKLIDYDYIWSGNNKIELLERFENEVRSSANVLS